MLKSRFCLWYAVAIFISTSISILSPFHSVSGWAQNCDPACPQVYSCCWGVSDITFKSLLPALIELKHEEIEVRLKIDEWQLPR